MTELSLPWANNGVGDGQAYDDDEWSDWQRILWQNDRTVQGVVAGYLDRLRVSNPAGVTIRVLPGAALVDGKFYSNDSNIDNTIVAPGAGSNYYTVVLAKDWAAQTVRVDLLGPDASSPPVVTQTDGTLWEISLATVQITSGGTITITDTRYYVAQSMTAALIARQGGSSGDWGFTPGTTEFNPAQALMQAGFIQWTGVAAANGSKTVTFPGVYKKIPLVFIQATDANITHAVFSVSTTQFIFSWVDQAGATHTDLEFNWFVIGE